MSRKLTLTLFCFVALAVAFSEVAQATEAPHRRNHVEVNRMLRKRQENSEVSVSKATSTAASSSSATPVSTPSSPASSSSSTASSQTPVSSVKSKTDETRTSTSISSTPVSSSTSATPNTSAATASTGTTESTQATTGPVENTAVSGVLTNAPGQSTKYQTVVKSSSSSSSATSSAAPSSSTSTTTKTTLKILVAIAGSVAAVAIIWTLIRKWKFRPSAQFEDRMQPIDWQPAGPDDGGLPSHGLNRAGSTASSFHSSSIHGSDTGHSNAINPIPEHDFTAGAANLAPVGGYADLARGGSPAPQMQEALSYGPSYTAPSYDQYGVPIHHGAYGGAGGRY